MKGWKDPHEHRHAPDMRKAENKEATRSSWPEGLPMGVEPKRYALPAQIAQYQIPALRAHPPTLLEFLGLVAER